MSKQVTLYKYCTKTTRAEKRSSSNIRVPVISKEGNPLMPTKASRARKWIKTGKAVKKWTKTGIFYVQLQVESSYTKTQEVVLALDSC
ncbi:MAG: RRXRR domain-containing protein, partial [Methanosarcinales archaeon]